MSGAFDAEALLAALAAEPAERRAELVRAAGPVESVLSELAVAIERLAITRVADAIRVSELVQELADRLDGARARSSARRARAQALAYSQRYDEALPVVLEAVQIADAAGLGFDAARARLAAVHPLVNLLRFEDAIASAEAARQAFLAAGRAELAGRADSSIGGVHQKMNRPAVALRHFDRGAALLGGDAVALAQLQSNRGLALLSLDRFGEAEAAYLAALETFERVGLSWAVAIVVGNLAELAARQGRLARALEYYERAQRRLDRDAAPAAAARIQIERADVFALLGQHAAALDEFRAALPELERNGLIREALQARAGAGTALFRLGDHGGAEAALRDVVAACELHGQRADAAHYRLVLAEIACAAGRFDEALDDVRAAAASSGDRPAAAAAIAHQSARIALAQGDLSGAEASIGCALPAAEALDLPMLRADVLHLRSRLRRQAGRTDDAIDDLRAAVQLVERVRGLLHAERFRASFHGDRAAIYADLAAAALDASGGPSFGTAFEAIELAKSRTLLDQVRGAIDLTQLDSAEGDERERELLRELGQLRGEASVFYSRLADRSLGLAGACAADEDTVDAWRRGIHERERRIDAIESRVSATRGAAGLFAPPAALADVQSRLASDAALILYFAAGAELLALIVRTGGVSVVRGLASMGYVAELVDRVHFQIRRALRAPNLSGERESRMVGDAQRALGALHDAVFRPLRTALEGAQRLVVVPHGPLHIAPLHALWDGERHLCAAHELTYAPSATLWLRLASRARSVARGGETLVVGVADELAPDIEQEAREAAAALGCREPLLGDRATVERVVAALPHAAVAHLACHGHFSSENAVGSGLRLADRWLTVREIYGLRLPGTVVVLSGCETARSAVGGGDDLVGLVRGFVAAGASAVVASQWIVNDSCTKALMALLYTGWTGADAPGRLAHALRAAQAEVRTQRPHPTFWAPFVVMGEL